MDELTNLWVQWSEGVVPPDTLLWGLELYWWNRIAIALQSVALVIVFFELVGTEGRQKVVRFFDFDEFNTLMMSILRELRRFFLKSEAAIATTALLPASSVVVGLYTLFGALNRYGITLVARPQTRLKHWLKLLYRADRKIGKRFEQAGLDPATRPNSLPRFRSMHGKRERRWVWAFAAVMVIGIQQPFYSDISPSVLELYYWGVALIVFFTFSSSALPGFILLQPLASASRILFVLIAPFLKRFFDERYERHWIAAALISGLVGLHFSILIG